MQRCEIIISQNQELSYGQRTALRRLKMVKNGYPGSHSLKSLKRNAEPDDKPMFVQYRASRGDAYRDCRRNSCGVMPVSALKARLNGPIDPNPQSSAIVRIGKWASAGSTRRRFASSMR